MTEKPDSEGKPMEHPVWPPEVVPQNDFSIGEHGRNTHKRLVTFLLIPFFAVCLPIAEGEAFDHIYAWLMPRNGFANEGPDLPLAIALMNQGNALFVVIMVPWLVLALVLWRRSPSLAIWLIFGALLGILWSYMRLSFLM